MYYKREASFCLGLSISVCKMGEMDHIFFNEYCFAPALGPNYTSSSS